MKKQEEDEILAQELSKLGMPAGTVGGILGGMVSGTSGVGAAAGAILGGQLGTHWAIQHLLNNVFEMNIEVAIKPAEALLKCFEVLKKEGKIIDLKEKSNFPCIGAIIKAGFLNLNPAIVTIKVIPLSASGSKIYIHGSAKEGLIKQRAGEKAARKIVQKLSEPNVKKII